MVYWFVKNISVSHIANGSSRLQPLVLGLGQAAGMAAALCVEGGHEPRNLDVRLIQNALLQDTTAPTAVIPLLNLLPDHPNWLYWQTYYLDHPEAYPASGTCPINYPLQKIESPIEHPNSGRKIFESEEQEISGFFIGTVSKTTQFWFSHQNRSRVSPLALSPFIPRPISSYPSWHRNNLLLRSVK